MSPEKKAAPDPAATEPTAAEAPFPEAQFVYDNELAGYKDFSPSLRTDMGYDRESDPTFVRNVPADMTTSWCRDPRLDNGISLAFMRSNGFRPVRVEEVTASIADDTRMVLQAFAVGPHDYVLFGDAVLLIGYRQYRDDRRASRRREARQRLDAHQVTLDGAGIQHHRSSRSAPLSEVL